VSQKSSLYRTIDILKRLNDGKKLCVTRLSEEYGVSDRTIRRDFELIRELFEEFMTKEGECYQAYKKVLLDEVLSATDLMTLANIVNLFGITQKESLIGEQTKALIEKSMSVYDFKSRPYENMQNIEIVRKLEHAIKFHKEIHIRYKTERAVTAANFRPYKILFLNENFYMVGENSSKNVFEFRRISMIEEVTYRSRTFIPHSDIVNFIQTIQTPWANFGRENKVVQLRVDKKIRCFFLLKKYLPSQEVVSTYDNGDILVEYRVTSSYEIEDLILKWLPDIEIIAPTHLKRTMKRILRKKYAGLK